MDPGNEDRQQTEIYALKSIYGNDFIECDPPRVWKGAPRLPEFIICVRHPDPAHAETTFFNLHIKLPKTYPKLAAPVFTIQSPSADLKARQLAEISHAIQAQVQNKKDVEMVFEAVDAAQAWLGANVCPPKEPIGSLAAQMARREHEEHEARRRREVAEKEQAYEREREREYAIQEEIRMNAEKLHQARKRAMSDVTEVPMDEEGSSRSLTETFTEDIEWQGVRFRRVHLFHPEKDCLGTIFQAEPISDDEASNFIQLEVFTVLFESKYYSTAQGRRKLKQIETECHRLSRLRHPNLLSMLAVKLVLSNTASPSRLSILRERRPSVTLHDVLEDCDYMREARATEYLTQILSALDAIHTADLIHRGIDTCCIGLVAASPGHSKRVKLHKVAYYVQLLNMNRSDPFSQRSDVPDTSTPEGWIPKDASDSPLVYTRNRDIHAAGIVLLQMLMGLDVIDRYPNVNEALRNSAISATMQQHILNMIAPTKKGVTAGSLLISLAGISISESMKTPAIAINSFTPGTPNAGYVSSSPPTDYMLYRPATRSTSRWKEDWQVLEHLGKGGYGSVVKAKNKIDERVYAVKKIRLRNGQSEKQLYREVNTLSRLNHRFIVRYYTTWIEYSDMESTTTSTVGSSAGTATDESAGTSTPGGYSVATSFNEDDPLAINWSKVKSPSNGHSFPSIHFTTNDASDSDESDNGDSGTTRSSGDEMQRAVTPAGSEFYMDDMFTSMPKLSKIMFIQMEYVERQTLQELVQQEWHTALPEEEGWRLFQQIIEGLVYMSSLKIIHRDIKLANIFVDLDGNIKIGDFGLATFNRDVIEPSDSVQPGYLGGDLTLEVGTTLYMAPEVRSEKDRPRALTTADPAKADMYSLGIVFFELNYYFGTASERIRVLENLRKPEIVFPPTWDANRTRQKQIITWLLQHDPSKRPNVVELSQSPLLPPKVEDEHFKNTLKMIVKSNSSHRQSLLTALFQQEPEPGHSFLYDSVEVPEYATLNPIVQDRMAEIFRLHGAVDMEPPLLLPVLDQEEVPSRAIFLDRNGKAVSLPDSLFVPFARLAARIGIRRIKRYHINDIYKADPVAGHPKVYKAAVFDIITQDVIAGPSASAAEAISIVDDCMNSFANLDKYEIQLSHTKIRSAIIDFIPSTSYTEVLKILLQTNASPSQRRQLFLEKSLSRNAVDLLDILFEGGTDIDAVCARLEKVSPAFSSSISESLREIRETIQFAVAIGVHRPLVFKPLFMLRNKNSFFDGICFEVVKGVSTNQKRWDILATGGRYDGFVNSFSPVKSRSDGVCAVGMQISLDKIAAALASFQSSSLKDSLKHHRSYGYWSPRRCDVYVAAHSSDLDGTLMERLEITSFLWRNGISADMMYEFGGAEGENIVDQCSREGILFIVYPRPRLQRRDQPAFKVKSVLKGTEYSMSRLELVPFLSQQVAEQRRVDASISGAPWVTEASQTSGTSKDMGDSNVQLLLPNDAKKQRKQTKQIFLDRAFEFRDALKDTITQSTMPLVALDVPTTVFEEMSKNTSWLSDDTAWRLVLAGFPPQQSAYAHQIRDTILKKKNDSCKFLILFAVKEERASLLTF